MNVRESCVIYGLREFMLLIWICIFFQTPLIVQSSNWPVFKEQATTLQCETTSECPTWFGCNNGTCECHGEPESIIKCDKDRAAVLACHCVTTGDEFSGQELIVGSCIFNCGRHPNHTIIDPSDQYFVLPHNISILNEDVWEVQKNWTTMW